MTWPPVPPGHRHGGSPSPTRCEKDQGSSVGRGRRASAFIGAGSQPQGPAGAPAQSSWGTAAAGTSSRAPSVPRSGALAPPSASRSLAAAQCSPAPSTRTPAQTHGVGDVVGDVVAAAPFPPGMPASSPGELPPEPSPLHRSSVCFLFLSSHQDERSRRAGLCSLNRLDRDPICIIEYTCFTGLLGQ